MVSSQTRLLRCAFTGAGLAFIALAWAQQPLTLDEALRLARERNGRVQAALLDVRAAQERVDQVQSTFLPTITPIYRYNSAGRRPLTGGGSSFSDDSDSGFFNVNWRLLDSGQRALSLRAARTSAEARRDIALQTLRQSLFTVHQQYLDTLRAEELQRIADAQVARTQTILEQTIARVEVGDAPRKDVLQARADALNARVQQLQARTRTTNTVASLKGTIGWDTFDPLPELQPIPEPEALRPDKPLMEMINQGLLARRDLTAQRLQAESQRAQARRLRRNAGVTFGVDADFDYQVAPRAAENRSLTFLVSYPLFGGPAGSTAREAEFSADAALAELRQAERRAQAEIEAAYQELEVNAQRMEAARLALEAARQNFAAAVDAQRLGVSDVVEVLTAQVSLVTAESNYVEAIYDYAISNVWLRLVTGEQVPGEVAVPNPS
jgi:outer membrane protein